MKSTVTRIKKDREIDIMVKSDTSAKKGVYRCTNCGAKWHLEIDQVLPLCPLCFNEIFIQEK